MCVSLSFHSVSPRGTTKTSLKASSSICSRNSRTNSPRDGGDADAMRAPFVARGTRSLKVLLGRNGDPLPAAPDPPAHHTQTLLKKDPPAGSPKIGFPFQRACMHPRPRLLPSPPMPSTERVTGVDIRGTP